jgi:hypothetical protein
MGLLGGLTYWAAQKRKMDTMTLFDSRKRRYEIRNQKTILTYAPEPSETSEPSTQYLYLQYLYLYS